MTERIQKLIAASGLMSRRAAEEAMAAGRVLCNGRPVSPGDRADPERDALLVDGRPLPQKERMRYLMLHKPPGYVTTLSDEKGRRHVGLLTKGVGTRVYPVGRLDMYSEGLLLMTNDGDFANRVMHPSHEVDKTYHVLVSGAPPERAAALLRKPMSLDGYALRPAQVVILEEEDGAWLSVTIHEGRNRQLRRMCQLAGLRVQRLIRVAEGGVRLGELKSGQWRDLTEEEIRSLLE